MPREETEHPEIEPGDALGGESDADPSDLDAPDDVEPVEEVDGDQDVA